MTIIACRNQENLYSSEIIWPRRYEWPVDPITSIKNTVAEPF